MEEITLKEYFERKGYGKGANAKGSNLSDFASLCNVSASLISHIYNGSYKQSRGGKAFARVENVLNQENFTLKLENNEANSSLMKENKKLKEENRKLSDKILELERELKIYSGLAAFCDRVSTKYGKGNKNAIEQGYDKFKGLFEDIENE